MYVGVAFFRVAMVTLRRIVVGLVRAFEKGSKALRRGFLRSIVCRIYDVNLKIRILNMC
jgi:hypothetical protein